MQSPTFRDVDSPELSELTDPSTVVDLVREAFAELAGDVLVRLPGLALALQNIFENLISGVLILMRKPYDQGEIVIVDGLEEVLEYPEPLVFLTGLGGSSVDFEVRVWFDVTTNGVPDMQDLCYRACKAALDREGFTIPWPIRTLAADMQPLEVSSHQLPPAPR